MAEHAETPCEAGRLTLANMGLVYNLAATYSGRGVDVDDLCQEGAIALLTAARRYTRSHPSGAKFCTYARIRIRGAMIDACCDAQLIRMPNYLRRILPKIEEARERLFAQLERVPTDEEVAREACVSLKRAKRVLHSAKVRQAVPELLSTLARTA